MNELDPASSIVLADSITTGGVPTGAIVVTGSHGGRSAGVIALRAGARAIAFHDAGIGLDDAGVEALRMFAAHGLPAIAVDFRTARIGDAGDMLANGRVSRVNASAAGLGVVAGSTVREACAVLSHAPPRSHDDPGPDVAGVEPPRREERVGTHGRRLVLLDSASDVRAGLDDDAIVVTGSHGGLIGGDPARALKAECLAAAFNDAGGGPDGRGTDRLDALQARGIAAVTVSSMTARIGDAVSTLAGTVSCANDRALRRGARPGHPLDPWVRTMLDEEIS